MAGDFLLYTLNHLSFTYFRSTFNLMSTAHIKHVLTPVLTLAFILLSSSSVLAAAPDGIGPWADNVKSVSQGLRKDGSVIPAPRSDSSSALGVAEDSTADGTFYSLGFGGVIELGFDNGISSGVIVVEATNAGYPTEKAKIEVSENGIAWVEAGQISQDGQVATPESVRCAKYVRITDVSNKDEFSDATADGYDVDGVKATGNACNPKPCEHVVVQGNFSNTTTVVSSTAQTGDNKANGNGKDVTIKTGNAKSNVVIAVGGNTNTAVLPDCCKGTNTDIKISGNGKKSKNTVILGSASKKSSKK